MFVAPAGTPQPIVDKLHAELKAIAALPEIKQKISGMGMVPIDTPSVADQQRYIQTEIDRWGKVIRGAGIAGSE